MVDFASVSKLLAEIQYQLISKLKFYLDIFIKARAKTLEISTSHMKIEKATSI
jgi:hypothetical protein